MKDDGLVCWLRWMRCGTSPSRAKVAGWIAPPEIGINNAPLDYEYVRLN